MAGIWDIVSGVTNRTQDLQNEMAQRDLVKAQALDTASQLDERKKAAQRREELAAQIDDPILKAGIYEPNFLMGAATMRKQGVQNMQNQIMAKLLSKKYGINFEDMGYGNTSAATSPYSDNLNTPQPQQQPSAGLEPDPTNDVSVEDLPYDFTQGMQPNVGTDGEVVQPPVDLESMQEPSPLPSASPQQASPTQPELGNADFAEMMGFLKGDPLKGMQVAQDIREKDPAYIEKVERVKGDETSRRKLLDTVSEDTDKIIKTEPQIQVIETALNDLVASGKETGVLSNSISWINAFGNQVGLDFGLGEGATYENISSATSQLAAPLAKQLGVNPTDFDYKQVLKAIASPDKSLAGNFALVDLQKQNIVRQKGKVNLINDLEGRGASLIEIKKAVTDYDKNYKIDVPKAMPNKKEQVKEGAKYYTNKGVFIWDGEKFNNVNE